MTAEDLRNLKLGVIRAIKKASKEYLNSANDLTEVRVVRPNVSSNIEEKISYQCLVDSIINAVETDFDCLIYLCSTTSRGTRR